jgi:hypothetical protein
MAKIKITETNGASAEDISEAIGKFLEQQKGKEAEEAPKSDRE